MNSREGGFTLLESLFVLSIFLIIASITAFLLKPQSMFLDKQLFLTQLKSDLLYAQQYAISHQLTVNVHILPEENLYYLKAAKFDEEFLISREIPEWITVVEGSMKLYFHFQPDGNINRFGSFYIHAGKDRYRFTFLIGKGRFYVAKE